MMMIPKAAATMTAMQRILAHRECRPFPFVDDSLALSRFRSCSNRTVLSSEFWKSMRNAPLVRVTTRIGEAKPDKKYRDFGVFCKKIGAGCCNASRPLSRLRSNSLLF